MAHSPSPPPPPPPLYPYWFYTSSLVIDDPLSPLPIATTTTAAKQPPRPFSRYDCTNLEAAYQELLDDLRSQPPETASESRNASQPAPLAAVKRTKSREVALEGHPLWNSDSDDDELQLRNEIPGTTPTADSGDSQAERWPSTGLSGSPTERRPSSGLSGSPLRKFMVPPSSSAPAYSTESTAAANTTKNPFIRSLSLSRATSSQPSSRRSSFTSGRKPPPSESPAPPPQQKEIPVGIQRLHKVLLPSLVMAPLYWSPLHDVSSVVRGTWFYKDSMLPVETEMANRLETGWEEVRAWTEEWEMELSSAVEVGREGEGKVRWQLWDTKPSTSAPSSRPGTAVELGAEQILPTSTANSAPSRAKPNEWDWVIFANSRDAYICRDTMLSFGQRRPLANIRRGRTVGIHVVRGFSESEWLKLHPQPNSKRPASTPARSRAASVAPTQSPIPTYIKEKNRRSYSTGSEFQAGGDVGGFEQHQEEGLGLGLGEDDEMRGKVTDLFLVIHG